MYKASEILQTVKGVIRRCLGAQCEIKYHNEMPTKKKDVSERHFFLVVFVETLPFTGCFTHASGSFDLRKSNTCGSGADKTTNFGNNYDKDRGDNLP